MKTEKTEQPQNGATNSRAGDLPATVREATTEALVQAREASSRAVRGALDKTAEVTSKLSTGQKVAVGVGALGAAVAAGFATKRLVERSNRREESTVYHLEPCEDGWRLRRASAEKAEVRFGTKKRALVESRELVSERAPSELVVHLADGSEQTRHSYDA